jgi:universal stress protein A
MLPLKRILCPTDFSEHSYKAANAASELASEFSATVHVLHVVPLIPTMSDPGVAPGDFDVDMYQQELEKTAQQDLQEVIHEKMPKESTVRAIVAHGDVASEIVRVADAEDADIIVIATHGTTGWRHFVLGSVAERVVRHATCPVLMVPARREQD